MKLKEGWAIIGNHGLYVGWHHTRREMIARHVADIEGISSVTFGQLTEDQTMAWHECRMRGDRAIKVSIHYVR